MPRPGGGFAIARVVDGRTLVVHDDRDQLLWGRTLPADLLWLRVGIDRAGRTLVVGQAGDERGLWLVSADGVLSMAPCIGQNGAVVACDGTTFFVLSAGAVVDGALSYRHYTRHVVALEPLRILDSTVHAADGVEVVSQGWLDYLERPDGDDWQSWTDRDRFLYAGLVCAMERGGVVVGQNADDRPAQVRAIGRGGVDSTVLLGDAFEPHIAYDRLTDTFCVVARRLGGRCEAVTCPPWPARVDRVDAPIVRVSRPMWTAFYTFHDRATTAPHNANFLIGAPDTRRYVTSFAGTRVRRYCEGASDSDIDSIEAAIAAARIDEPNVRTLCYWPRQAWGRVPARAQDIGVEAYCLKDERLPDFEARVRAAAARCAAPWLIGQCYTSNANLTSDLRALVPVYARLLNDSAIPWQGAAFFSGEDRATGWQDHLDVHALYEQLLTGVHVPVGQPPAPPVIHPPAPADPIPTVHLMEMHMDTQRIALIGPGGMFARVDPSTNLITFDRTSAGADETFELSKPDDKFAVRAIAADRIVNFRPKWSCDGVDLQRQFETRPADARGPDESPTVVKLPSGKILAFVEHDFDGRQFTSAPLTVVVL